MIQSGTNVKHEWRQELHGAVTELRTFLSPEAKRTFNICYEKNA